MQRKSWILKPDRIKICALLYIVLLMIFVFLMLPIIAEFKPVLEKTDFDELPDVIRLEDETFLVLNGSNLENVDFLYIDGKRVDFYKTYDYHGERLEKEKQIAVQFEKELYENKNSITLQVARDVASVYQLKSNKITLDILHDNDLSVPQIKSASINEIQRPCKDAKLMISGSGICDSTRVLVNGERTNLIRIDEAEQNIEVIVPEDVITQTAGKMDIQLMQELEDGSNTWLMSKVIQIPVYDYDFNTIHLSDQWTTKNRQIVNLNTMLVHASSMTEKIMARKIECLCIKVGYASDDQLAVQLENGEWYPLLDMLNIMGRLSELNILVEPVVWNETAINSIYEGIISQCEIINRELLNRVIPMVSGKESYAFVMRRYNFSGAALYLEGNITSKKELQSVLEETGLRNIVIESGGPWDQEELIREMNTNGCRVYAAGINDYEREQQWISCGGYGVISDVLTPLEEQHAARSQNISSQLKQCRAGGEYFQMLEQVMHEMPVTVLIAGIDDVSNVDGISDNMQELGLLQQDIGFRESYVAIIEDGEVKLEFGSDSILSYTYESPYGWDAYLVSQGYLLGDNANIIVNGIDYSMHKRGLNIVVCDSETGLIVDRIVVDNYDAENKLVRAEEQLDTVARLDNDSQTMDVTIAEEDNERFMTVLIATPEGHYEMQAYLSMHDETISFEDSQTLWFGIVDQGRCICWDPDQTEDEPFVYSGHTFEIMRQDIVGEETKIRSDSNGYITVDTGFHILYFDKYLGVFENAV